MMLVVLVQTDWFENSNDQIWQSYWTTEQSQESAIYNPAIKAAIPIS